MKIEIIVEYDTEYSSRGWNVWYKIGEKGTPVEMPSLSGAMALLGELYNDPGYNSRACKSK